MLSWMNIARAAKVVALVGFLMPWLVVSCQGTEIASATGLDMAMGTLRSTGDAAAAQDSDPAWWAILALLLIIGGLVATFVMKQARQAALTAAGAAAAALLLCAVGMNMAISEARSGGSPEASAAAAAVQFDLRYGYWLTLAALLVAAGAGFMAWQGRPFPALGSAPPADPA